MNKVFFGSLESFPRQEIEEVLSVEELERAKRILSPKAQSTFLHSRYYLRKVLSLRLSRPPKEIRLFNSQKGKPYLSSPTEKVFFNISHSGSFLAIALSDDYEVGIDIEKIDSSRPIQNLAKKILHRKELEKFSDLDQTEKVHYFYQRWTAKESFSKCLGLGLSLNFSTLDLSDLSIPIEYENKSFNLQELTLASEVKAFLTWANQKVPNFEVEPLP